MPTIAVSTAASGLDIYLRYDNVLTDPSAITYNIKNIAGTVVASGAGYKRSVGHYDARNSTIPTGHAITSSWSIVWNYTSPGGVASTSTEEFTVVSSMSATFTNVDDTVDAVKLDMSLTTEFTQDQLEDFIEKALRRLNRKLRLTGTSSELSISSTTGAISPSPDDTILDLIILQTECLISKTLRSSSILAGTAGLMVRDQDQQIDTRSSLVGRGNIVEDFCKELDEAIADYIGNQSDTYGEVVWYGNSNITEDIDHNGDADNERDWTSPFDD